ncbi:MAG: hypothetical protein F6J93_22935 [Oscillatoria sp. SIO1A7]|nr:hypothetical protein [Oscillatoria sp. SIO1A7]
MRREQRLSRECCRPYTSGCGVWGVGCGRQESEKAERVNTLPYTLNR